MSYNWFNCLPNEIFLHILKLLDENTLINSLFVCKKWRNTITNTVVCNEGAWKKINQINLLNEYENVRKRSLLSDEELFYSTQLWNNVREATPTQVSCFKCKDEIVKLQVYRDNLRVVCCYIVENVKVESFVDVNMIRNHLNDASTICVDYEENDVWIVTSYRNKLVTSRKVHYEDFHQIFGGFVFGKHKAIKLYEHGFYFTDDQTNIWFDRRGDRYFLAKHHGIGQLIEINIFEDKVYVLSSLGEVLQVNQEQRSFDYLFRLPNPVREKVHLMFYDFNVIVGVSAQEKFECITTAGGYCLYIRYPNLSCAIRHGNLLIFGFQDGKIEIHLFKKILQRKFEPEVTMDVKEFQDYNREDPAVKSMNVHEGLNKHTLFVATTVYVYKISFLYPNWLLH